MRPTWDQIWMNIAREVSRRSPDETYKVGTIIVTDDNTQVLSLGRSALRRCISISA